MRGHTTSTFVRAQAYACTIAASSSTTTAASGRSSSKMLSELWPANTAANFPSRYSLGNADLSNTAFVRADPAGFGLRRLLIDEGRNPKGELGRGDRKSLQTDRVVLTPGPLEEVEHVQSIYLMFVEEGKSEREIAAELNRRGVLTDLGRPWTRASIHQILTNEKYIGNNIFHRVSYKLKQRRIVNNPETWVRANGVFPSIVDRALFDRARAIIGQRGNHYSDEHLLSLLRAVLEEEGSLSGLIIDEREDMPSSSLYPRFKIHTARTTCTLRS
jgi:Recombinase